MRTFLLYLLTRSPLSRGHPRRAFRWSASSIFLALVLMVVAVGSELYFDINAYLRYAAGRNVLAGIETRLVFRFRYCNDHGILLYQDGRNGFFALGVHSQKIYLEWQTSTKIIELYVGDGSLRRNQTYSVVIMGLLTRQQTVAYIDNVQVPVNYLVTVDESLNVTLLYGDLYIGGYSDVSLLKVNTERLIAYLVVCLVSIETSSGAINFSSADQSVGVIDHCPSDFCALPLVVSVTTLQSFISMNLPLPPRTRTRISFSFQTKSTNGMIFYFGGPAYLLLYLSRSGSLVLALNTRGSGLGAFNSTTVTGFNDGQWHYVHVIRDGNMANLTNDYNQILTSVQFGTQGDAAQTLNAAELMIGGVRNLSDISFLPFDAQVSLTGCYEAPRFIVYSITAEPAPLLNFDAQIKEERNISHGGCFASSVCDPVCLKPSQVCNFSCVCAPGFFLVSANPSVICQNIDDCVSNPCLHGGTCTDLILDYTCNCPIEFNRGKNCEIANNCYPPPCANGATCIVVDNGSGYSCSCAAGWTGVNCTSNIDECQSRPCQNGGSCFDQIGTFFCSCQSGYTGAVCEVNVNECASLPCINGGTCTDGINSYTCSCSSGWQGAQCDVNINECLSRPCLNNGVCNDGFNQYFCTCLAGFTGSLCQTDIDDCAFGYCKNNASCTDLVNSYSCSCSPGWTGRNCTEDIQECLSQPCWNSGTCLELTNAFRCICASGYSGTLCDLDINECQSNPCINNGTCQDLVNGFTCHCTSAWNGTLCQTDVNECLVNPCQNGGTCINFIGSFQCRCAAGFSSSLCEINVDDCSNKPCQHEGTCVDGVNSYSCVCTAGYTGLRCEVNVNECLSSPCQNGGTCIDNINGYICLCSAGFTGTNCASDIDECSSQPCQNNGTCVNGRARFSCVCVPGFTGFVCSVNADDCFGAVPHQCRNGAICVDGINSYTCQCMPGWTGRFCDQDINECASSPCNNSGSCVDLVNQYSCLCPPNFTGAQCSDDVNECLVPPCRNYVNCTNTYGGYDCQCLPGYTGKNCDMDIDECASQPCYFNGTCTDLVNGYRCTCFSLYMGTRCEAVIRQCPLYFPCGNNAVCVEKPAGGYTCYCKSGYEGAHCESKINSCRSNPCFNGGTCTPLEDGFNCSCIAGYTGPFCKVDVDECASQPCQNQGVCTEPEINMYRCQCQPGYNGTNCQNIIDNCASSPCQPWQNCTNLVNNYTCSCPVGYTGSRCEVAFDKCLSKPCLNGATCESLSSAFLCHCTYPWSGIYCESKTDPCYPNPCLAFGTCVPDTARASGYRCYCVVGFIGDRCEGDTYQCRSNPCQNNGTCLEWTTGINGYDCICHDNYTGATCQMDARTCQAQPCINGATCTDLPSGYQCACVAGWTGNRCEVNIDECQALAPCLNGGGCIDGIAGYTCNCSSYWTGQNCSVDVKECLSGPCLNSGSCVENIGAPYSCQCREGFTGSSCETRLSVCLSGPCRNNGTCLDLIIQFICSCSPGFSGTSCETPVSFCTPDLCLNGGSCAISANLSTVCHCPAGFAGSRCEINIDECVGLPCLNGGTCVDGINSYSCSCTPGFTGFLCETVYKTCPPNPCQNGGACVNSNGSIVCQCTSGYTGPLCERNVDDCVGQPCLNNGTCMDGLNSFICTCTSGFSGPNCSVNLSKCVPNPCSNNGVCREIAPDSFQCICPSGVTGRNCESVLLVTFEGNNFIQVQNPLPPRRRRKRDFNVGDLVANNLTSLSFSFSTTIQEGIMIFALGASVWEETSFILLELDKGKLRMSAGATESHVAFLLPLSPLGVNSTLVEVAVGGGWMNLTRDGGSCDTSPECRSASRVTFQSLMLNGPMYIGGVAKWTPFMRSRAKSLSGFTGCLGNVIVNGNVINLASLSQPGVPSNGSATPTKPQPGCSVHTPCSADYCSNGGTCTDLWMKKVCACTSAYGGDRCQLQVTANFVNSAMGSFRPLSNSTAFTQIQFYLSLNSNFGTVLYTLDSFLFCLDLVNNQLELHLVTSLGHVTSRAAVDVMDGSWSQIELLVTANQVLFIVTAENGTVVHNDSLSGSGMQTLGQLFVGKLHGNSSADVWRKLLYEAVSSIGFTGCLKNLSVNGELLDLGAWVPLGFGNDPLTPTATCAKEGYCHPNPCLNGGGCSSSWYDYTCSCAGDYNGKNCSETLASTFDGLNSSSTLYADTSLIAFGDTFSFEFRTRLPDGQLMLIQLLSNSTNSSGTIGFSLASSKLQLSVSPVGGSENSVSLSDYVSDGAWHFVNCQRSGKSFNVSVGMSTVALASELNLYSQDLKETIIVSVGTNTSVQGQSSYFRGCLRGLQFNNEPISFIKSGSWQTGLTVDSVSLTLGCYGDNVCSNATCPPNSSCIDNWNAFTCDCHHGWTGLHCNESIATPCSSQPCLNNGTCLLPSDEQEFLCQCSDAFTGRRCQTANPCHQNPCQNNATCTPDSASDNSAGNFTCACHLGWFGSVCDEVDLCVSNPCGTDGHLCNRFNGSYTCTCLPQFTGRNCETVVNQCETNRCLNGGTCVFNATVNAVESNFSCFCPRGFTGKLCETEFDFCASNPCLNNGTCILNSGSPSAIQPGYTCNCSAGFEGTSCGIVVNLCTGVTCLNGICQSTLDGFKCFCFPGFNGTNCELDYRDGVCNSHPCLNSGTCQWVTASSYECLCPQGFSGSRCETDLNVCSKVSCQNGGTCVAVQNGYTCACASGFSGKDCQLLVNSCGFTPPPCNHGICSFLGKCSCPEVVSVCRWNNESCQEKECALRAQCVTRPQSYDCNCTGTGYVGDNCEMDIDECNVTTLVCLNAGQCENLPGNFRCNCRQGFTGRSCETDIDECATNPFTCLNSGICTNLNGSFSCNCTSPWTGTHCETNGTCPEGNSTCNCHGQICQAATSGLPNESKTAIIVAIIVLCVLILLAIIFIWYVRRSRRYRGNYKPSKYEETIGTVPMSAIPPTPSTSIFPSNKEDLLI